MGLTLWLVRHAPVQAAPGLCYGRSDLPAEPAATQAAARALAQAWVAMPAQRGAQPLVMSSPLQRARLLAQAFVDAAGPRGPDVPPMAVHTDARLAEMDFGQWEGRTWDSLGEADFAPWMADFARHRVGGGESVAALHARVLAAWHDCQQQAQGQDRHPVLWFTHAGVIRCALLLHAGRPLPQQASDWPREACEPGQWKVLRWDDAGQPLPFV